MSDVALSWNGENFDLGLAKNDIVLDDGLKTAVAISLFTDRKVEVEELPPGESMRRGWWGDAVGEVADLTGSRLWLLARAKQTEETRKRAEEYAAEALEWMVGDGVARSVDVAAEWVRAGFLGISVTVHRPAGQITFRFNVNWNAEIARGMDVL